MSAELEYYRNLEKIMLKTRGCRFTASDALLLKERLSIVVVAALVVYVLAWAVISLSYPEVFGTKHARFYNAISVVASVALLVISIMDYAFGRSKKAEKLHRNALQISALVRGLERELVKDQPDFDHVRKIAEEYEACVSETQINHTSMDFRRWEYHSAAANGPLQKVLFYIRRIAYDLWFYGYSMFLYIIVILMIVTLTLWYSISIVLPTLLHS